MNIKTIDPKLVDIHIDNCVDLQNIYSEFNSILDEYPNEKVISNVHEYCKHKCDSIYSEIDFYVSLEQDSLTIKDTLDGSQSEFKNKYPIIGRLYSALQPGEYLILDDTGNPNFRNNNTEVLIQVSRLSGNQVIKESQLWKPIDFTQHEIENLQASIGLRSLSTWFLMFWLEKFRTAADSVKEAVLAQLPSSEFYSNFSESIGCLKNVEFIKQTHTTAITDTNVDGDIPYPYTSVLNYILTDPEKRVSLELSKKTHQLYRKNIQPLTTEYDSGDLTSTYPPAHGVDIKVDDMHYTRMKAFVSKIHTTLQQELQTLYTVLMFISNNSNALKTPKVVYKKYIENNMVDIDLLKTKVKKISTQLRSDSLLGIG
jgi:hypothetical protein